MYYVFIFHQVQYHTIIVVILKFNKTHSLLAYIFFVKAYFGDQHGVEFVYKEPKLTPLSDISERLLCQYGDKFGRDNVRIIMDSNTVSII